MTIWPKNQLTERTKLVIWPKNIFCHEPFYKIYEKWFIVTYFQVRHNEPKMVQSEWKMVHNKLFLVKNKPYSLSKLIFLSILFILIYLIVFTSRILPRLGTSILALQPLMLASISRNMPHDSTALSSIAWLHGLKGRWHGFLHRWHGLNRRWSILFLNSSTIFKPI